MAVRLTFGKPDRAQGSARGGSLAGLVPGRNYFRWSYATHALARILHEHHLPGKRALHVPAPPGGRGAGEEQTHPGHGLQRRSGRGAPLPGGGLPARTAGHPFRPAARNLPGAARGAKRHHSGRGARHQYQRRGALLHHPSLRALQQNAYQLRRSPYPLCRGLSRRTGHANAA